MKSYDSKVFIVEKINTKGLTYKMAYISIIDIHGELHEIGQLYMRDHMIELIDLVNDTSIRLDDKQNE